MKLFHRGFAGAAIAISMAAASGSPEVVSEEVEAESLTVTKTVVSSTMRFFFPVGLEGTGHHYIVDVERHLFKTNKGLGKKAGLGNVNSKPYEINQSMVKSVQRYSTSLNTARSNMRTLAQRSEKLDFPGTVVFVHGRNSYPNGFGPNKALKYIDLRMMAEVAEAEGVDFRVLYLRRPVKDILIANTMHRDFQTVGDTIRYLHVINMADVAEKDCMNLNIRTLYVFLRKTGEECRLARAGPFGRSYKLSSLGCFRDAGLFERPGNPISCRG